MESHDPQRDFAVFFCESKEYNGGSDFLISLMSGDAIRKLLHSRAAPQHCVLVMAVCRQSYASIDLYGIIWKP